MTPYLDAVWSIGPIYDTVTGPVPVYGGAYQSDDAFPTIGHQSWKMPGWVSYITQPGVRSFSLAYPNVTTLELVFRNNNNVMLAGTDRTANRTSVGSSTVSLVEIEGQHFIRFFCIDNGANQNNWTSWNPSSSQLDHPTPIALGEIVHVVAEHSVGSHLRLTVNGTEVLVPAAHFTPNNEPNWSFGRHVNWDYGTGHGPFELMFAAVYDQGLTPLQVSHHYDLLMADNATTGTAIMSTGAPADKVLITMYDKRRIIPVTPRPNGTWYASLPENEEFYLTYLADGCPPITHGPYRHEPE